ncbi:ABC transporter transmembrane region domain-containing protein [Phthorimaea operculella]|nr:ABC transporter transmembrane region domain-containing protein [Phthorimaea operculella]
MGLKKDKPEKNEQEPPNLSYFQIFRYATCLEKLAIVVGVILGFFSGGGVTYNMVQFGEISTAFLDRTTNKNISYLPLTQFFGGGKRVDTSVPMASLDALVDDGIALAIGMFVSVGASLLLCVLSVGLISWSALRQIARIRRLFLQATLRQDMAWFDTDSEFNLASKMAEDMMKLKDGMGDKICVVANLVGTAALSLVVAFPLGWELTLACGAVVPFSIAASVLLTNYQTKSSIHEMQAYSQAGKQAEEVLKSVKTIVAYGGETKEIERYRKLLEPAEQYGRRRGLYSGLGNGFNWVLTYSLNAIGLVYGTRLVLDDDLLPEAERRYRMGTMFSVVFCVYMATQSITLCVPHAEVFAAARGAAAGIFQLIERVPSIDSLQKTGVAPRRVIGEIVLEDVHFSYPSRPDVQVLKGFNLHIKAGECVALVGSSGCGKSTILQLLQRLYDPRSGSVKLDGKDVRNLNLGWLRSCLGVVGQEPVLFRGTIHDNISLGCPEATREEVQRVAEMAYAHDFITRLPNGYDTVIGERGASLSGGQKQRVAIARSLLREPAVLLLDEATSALDSASERQVQAALDRAAAGRTTLMVSHRLSTIVNAHRIICMDAGKIVEEGTHEELMKKKGFYYNLVTTTSGKEVKEPEGIAALPEEGGEGEGEDVRLTPRVDVKRRSVRRHRRHSTRRESHDWMTPRGSIVSVMSTGLQNFVYNADFESDEEVEEEDEEVKPISDWALLRLNAPEWPYMVVGSIAAFMQGACFPVFAVLFGLTASPISDWALLRLNAPEWPYMVVGSIAAFMQGACFPVFAVLFGLTASIFKLRERNEVTYKADLYAGMFVLVAAVAGTSMCLQGYSFTHAGLKMTSRLRQQYFGGLLRQEIGFFDKASNTVGAMCARLSGDAAEVQGATGMRVGLILQGFSSVFVGFILAMSYNWKLTLVGAAFLPLMVGSIWLEGIVSQKSQQNERAAMESATAVATEAIVSIRTVQSLGVEQIFLEKFNEELGKACAAVSKKTRWRGLVLGMGVYVPFLSYISATVYGASLVAAKEIEYGVVMLVNEALLYGAYMLGQSLVYAPSFNSAKECGARVLALINRVPKIKTEYGVKDKKDWAATGAFSVKDVQFCYPTRPNQRILKGVELKAEAGKTVALVGSSGCGKSTILQLIQRFYDPETGNIELDGRDIKTQLTLPRLRRQLGVVQQEPVLFDRTLAENIAYGDNNRKVTMHEIVAAAKAANIHSFIVSLPKGYDTNLGSAGAQLSGGQKQRVCIARALIRAPRLLLLDEATSALDANSERAVTEALEKAAKGRTCITIAHRLSTIKDANLICVLDKGKIVERGTHEELLCLKGHYWQMCREQGVLKTTTDTNTNSKPDDAKLDEPQDSQE